VTPGAPPEIPTEPESQPEVPPETEPSPPPAPRTREYQLSAATRSLVTQAQNQAASGNFPVAAASIERALRIEPSNPLLWIELGKVRQAEGNFAQAESMGRKALSLAVGDARAQASAWRLVAESLRSRGRVQQAQEAQAAADALSPR
jgi:tetratricopeptide (TPR) repeat protein